MTRLLLLRHGHIEDRGVMEGHTWAPLSRIGRAEATLTARHLRAAGDVGVVYTSPLLRARQTAEIVAVSTGLCLSSRRCDFLAEIDCGELTAVPLARVSAEYPALWEANQRQDDDRFRWPGGESYRELRARVLWGLRSLARAHEGERVLVVTHTGVISQVLGWIHGASAGRWGLYRPRSGTFTEVAVETGRWRAVCFDEGSHLAPLRHSGRTGWAS